MNSNQQWNKTYKVTFNYQFLSEAFSAEERRQAKEELRILKEKNNEFKSYFKQGSNAETLWKKK
jgi:hypothetical protein